MPSVASLFRNRLRESREKFSLIGPSLRKIIARMAQVVGSEGDAKKDQPARAEGAAPATAAPQSSGFRARLDGLSLFDLVQLECLARSRRIVRVASVTSTSATERSFTRARATSSENARRWR